MGGGKKHIDKEDDFLCLIIKYRHMSGALEKLRKLLEVYFDNTRRIYEESRGESLVCLFAFSRDEYYSKGFDILERFFTDFRERRFDTGSYFLAVSERKSGYREIQELYMQAVCQLQKFFFLGYGSLVRQEREEKQRIADPAKIPVKEFGLALLEKNADQAVEIAEKVYHYLKEQWDSLPDGIKNIFFTLQLEIMRKTGMEEVLSVEDTKQDYLWMRFNDFETVEECYIYLRENICAYFQNKEDFISGNIKIDQIVRYVRTNFGDVNLSVRDIADAVGLSPQYMTVIFKEKVGITLGQFIRNIRLEHSRRMLEDTDLSITAIALVSGYGDANYWAKVFRKEYGMTPSEYRKRGWER